LNISLNTDNKPIETMKYLWNNY